MDEFHVGVDQADQAMADRADQAMGEADPERIRKLPLIPKKKKPDLELGELPNEDEEMIVTNE